MSLTDLEIKHAKPREKPYKLYDAGGLFVSIRANGSKLFQMKYRLQGAEQLLSFGAYPEVSLAAARAKREAARALIAAGADPRVSIDPAPQPVSDPKSTFEAVAREWHALQVPRWSKRHALHVIESLQSGVFAAIGGLQVDQITPPMMLEAVRGVEARGAIETAHRIRQRCSAVFLHAIASGRATADPAAVIAKALKPVIKGRQPALIDLDDARKMLAKVEAELCHPITKLAFRALALTSVRPGELRSMEWCELEQLDGDAPLWRIPAERMKMKREHLVPLSRQAVELLAVAREISGNVPIVFPSTRWARRPISENAIGYLINRAGYQGEHVPHGWRATFSSVMNERYRADRAVIDLMLAHVSDDKTESAYNRAAHMDRRRELAQLWADLILKDAPAAEALLGPMRRRRN